MTAYDVLEIISDIRITEYSSGVPIAPSEKFYYHSHCLWALSELENEIWKKEKTITNIMDFLEEYRRKMDDWSCLPDKPADTCWMYAIAYNMVTYVIDQVILIDEALGMTVREKEKYLKE